MFVRKKIVERVVKLFTEMPSYRDDRYGTIEYICNTHYKEIYGKSIRTDFKLLSDIDRAFRQIQRQVPNLRGKNWIKRQIQSGELANGDYPEMYNDKKFFDIVEQLELF